MKKLITYIKRFIICFSLVAYIFPTLCASICSFRYIVNSNATVSAKENKKEFSAPLLNSSSTETLNKDNVQKFADTIFNQELRRFNVPGAVLSVVKDNHVLFEKGYGYSDIDKKTPVNPKTTVFRAASISKLFTATAVMQLKEKGKINLNENVNNYLKGFQIKDNFSKPVTLDNLLTHTGGFDERIIGESELDNYHQEKPLKDTLTARIRPIIREPGEAIQYSNYGMAVAGYAVESVSGTTFDKYMEDNILKPLHMNDSSFVFDKKTLANLSQGYDYKNGVYKKVPMYGNTFLPAGGLKTTADDMSKFMIAHLNNGTYDNTSILSKASIEDIHKKHFPLDKNIPCMCYGFAENYINGTRVLGQGGDDYGFHSMLYLIPGSNVGFFISTNGDNGAKICGDVAGQFMNRYYPQTKPQANMNNTANFNKSNLKNLEGAYIPSRYPRGEIGKLLMLMSQPINVKSTKDTLIIKYSNGQQDAYKETSPLLFKNVMGNSLTFITNKQGKISYMLNSGSTIALEKIQWYENLTLHKIIFVIFLVLFLSMAIAMILFNLKNRNNKKPLIFKYHRWVIAFICILNLVFLIGMAKECITLLSSLIFLTQLSKAVIYLLTIPIITTILTLGLIISICLYWHNKKSNLGTIIPNILIYCIFLAFTLYLNYWNLLGFKF